MRLATVALGVLSLSVGWGIRGNFGHEYGAMLPGALATMGLVLLSNRPDWWRRTAYFGMFGALGWSFGGSISYMQVIAYTHSGHSPSVLYGFASLFVIGGLWAAMGGAGAALPATLSRDRLREFFPPTLLIFAAWLVESVWLEPWLETHGYDLNWYDTDWLGVLIASFVALAYGMARQFDRATTLILYMCIGWYIAFLSLVVGLGLRMTPPRGDNWAGCLGMVAAILVYCYRYHLAALAFSTIATGIAGGIGYALSVMLKLVNLTSGLETNWHSVLEQTQGLFHGLALALTMGILARRQPPTCDEDEAVDWTDIAAILFVWGAVTYLNLRKNPMNWSRDHIMADSFYNVPIGTWFNFGYIALIGALWYLMMRHRERPIALVPSTWQGKGQLIYVVLLWWMVVGNFERALPGFAAQRLITEGVIHLNAVLCTLLLLACARPAMGHGLTYSSETPPDTNLVRRAAAIGLVIAMTSIALDWGVVRAIYGDKFAGHANLHIRFGPNATTGQPR
jgi:hypothetical protein